MSETETIDPTDAEPRTYGSESLYMERLDPPKQDEPLPFDSSTQGLEEAAAERTKTAAERNVIDVLQFKDLEGKVHEGDKITSPEYAADQLTAYREQKALLEQQAIDAELVQAIDENRGQATTEKIADELVAPVERPAVELQPEMVQDASLPAEMIQAFAHPEFVQKAI